MKVVNSAADRFGACITLNWKWNWCCKAKSCPRLAEGTVRAPQPASNAKRKRAAYGELSPQVSPGLGSRIHESVGPQAAATIIGMLGISGQHERDIQGSCPLLPSHISIRPGALMYDVPEQEVN